MSAARYAIYFAPAADSPWWRFGAGWLGRDERCGAALPQPPVPGIDAAAFHALTAEPRRYGFHATLKAPFRLRAGVDEALLRQRLAELAAGMRELPLGPLEPGRLGDFVALQPRWRPFGLENLAAECVLRLEDLRAPLTPEELARRRPERLQPVERDLLQRFGYPYVLGRFRFHMTLSAPVEEPVADLLIAHACARIEELNAQAPLGLDRLCLFRQDDAAQPFVRVHDEVLLP